MKRIVWCLDALKVVAYISALLLLLVSQYLLTSAMLTLALVSTAIILGVFIGAKERYRGVNIVLVFIELLALALIIWIYRHDYLINGIGLLWLLPYFIRIGVSYKDPKKEK